jgi:heterotetrameric sarcosine oxidase gamma subunit
MTLRESVTVTDMSITALPATPLHALEIWSNPAEVAVRFAAATNFELPSVGRSSGSDTLRLIRFEPTVWLVEGDPAGLAGVLGGDGALTAIGGGIVRIRLSGPKWRSLLMEGGVFDAEAPGFAPGCSAATIIDHVNVRLYVESADACVAYVPLSYAADMIHFWETSARTLP